MRMLDYINFQIVRVISPAGTYQDDKVQKHYHKQ
jgi:hypothetical protein